MYVISSKVLDLNLEIRAIDETLQSETDVSRVEDLKRKRKVLADVCMGLLSQAKKITRKEAKANGYVTYP